MRYPLSVAPAASVWELGRAILFDALQKVHFPCQISVRGFCIIWARLVFEPDVDRFVSHFFGWSRGEIRHGPSRVSILEAVILILKFQKTRKIKDSQLILVPRGSTPH